MPVKFAPLKQCKGQVGGEPCECFSDRLVKGYCGACGRRQDKRKAKRKADAKARRSAQA